MKINTPIHDPNGRLAKVITLPIPGRTPATAVIQYEDGRAFTVDLAQCTPIAHDQVIDQVPQEAQP